jgi:hypothetical protein
MSDDRGAWIGRLDESRPTVDTQNGRTSLFTQCAERQTGSATQVEDPVGTLQWRDRRRIPRWITITVETLKAIAAL